LKNIVQKKTIIKLLGLDKIPHRGIIGYFKENVMRYGLCCISLGLQELDPPVKFQTMTYKRFSALPRTDALTILGDRILNNLITTDTTIRYCAQHDYCYRLSSDIFPLITYDEANICLEDLPNYDDIDQAFDAIAHTIQQTNVRVSCHPSEFNSLASLTDRVVEKTIV
jgi:UV DNA damage repair endonuclease